MMIKKEGYCIHSRSAGSFCCLSSILFGCLPRNRLEYYLCVNSLIYDKQWEISDFATKSNCSKRTEVPKKEFV